MKICRAIIVPYSATLARPLVTTRGAILIRDGFHLRLNSESDVCGIGEAAPAYWIGDEQIDDTRTALDWIAAETNRVRDSQELRARFLQRKSIELPLTPAASCALDTALVDLESQSRGLALTEMLGGEAGESIESSALLSSRSVDSLADEARHARDEGYRCFKLKVGGRALEDDIRALKAVRDCVGDSRSIRLDANRAWRFDEAENALRRFSAYGIEFVEEPLMSARAGDYIRLRDASGVAIALDESIIHESDLATFLERDRADYLVVKAARIGGPSRILQIAKLAQSAGMQVVVTDSIESQIGMATAIHVAAALSHPRSPVGLGGARILAPNSISIFSFGVSPVVVASGPGLRVVPRQNHS